MVKKNDKLGKNSLESEWTNKVRQANCHVFGIAA